MAVSLKSSSLASCQTATLHMTSLSEDGVFFFKEFTASFRFQNALQDGNVFKVARSIRVCKDKGELDVPPAGETDEVEPSPRK